MVLKLGSTELQRFGGLPELSSHYTSTSPAMYPGSLLSHSSYILGSIPIITWNLRHTIIAYIYVRLGLGSDCLVKVRFG